MLQMVSRLSPGWSCQASSAGGSTSKSGHLEGAPKQLLKSRQRVSRTSGWALCTCRILPNAPVLVGRRSADRKQLSNERSIVVTRSSPGLFSQTLRVAVRGAVQLQGGFNAATKRSAEVEGLESPCSRVQILVWASESMFWNPSLCPAAAEDIVASGSG